MRPWRRHSARGLSLTRMLLLLTIAALTPFASPHPPGPAAAQLLSLKKIDPALLQQMGADRTKLLPVIIEMAPLPPPFVGRSNEQLAQRALTLLRLYGRPVGALALINGAAGFATAAAIEVISLDPGLAYVHADVTVRPQRGPAPASVAGAKQLSAPYPRVVKADQVWRQGATGRGVTVAVLDSGIAADPDLTQATPRLLAAVSFAGTRDPLRPDPGGHGTHVAGIVAGDGTRSGGEYVGIAPGANLVDVRVLDKNGSGRVSSVIRGIEWVLARRVQYNIRIINLSLGAPPSTPYRLDPLAAAVEIAWKRGLVVVAASGNRGPNNGTVDTPGIDPYVITVGATDDHGSVAVGDDDLALVLLLGHAVGLDTQARRGGPGTADCLAARPRQHAGHAVPRPPRPGRQRRHLLPPGRHVDVDPRRGRRAGSSSSASRPCSPIR